MGLSNTVKRGVPAPSCNCRNCGAAYEFGDLACRYCKSERIGQLAEQSSPIPWATTKPEHLPYLEFHSSPLPPGAGGELWTATVPAEDNAAPASDSFSSGGGGEFGGGGASGDY